ncbi:MAG: hypothetical protein LBK52_05870 [Deltaproteobacteria bacterium]|jgi:hypothetical protein|nr:hypothetical protein [Deltaproteobacteria bacterium]
MLKKLTLRLALLSLPLAVLLAGSGFSPAQAGSLSSAQAQDAWLNMSQTFSGSQFLLTDQTSDWQTVAERRDNNRRDRDSYNNSRNNNRRDRRDDDSYDRSNKNKRRSDSRQGSYSKSPPRKGPQKEVRHPNRRQDDRRQNDRRSNNDRRDDRRDDRRSRR